ncbi:hypothetical protein [Shewanella putrefaciens]|uniref:hypothetical protein n=1 Tax=Shewanella putrefaciens TaxID=24 RepID=UPI0024311AE6|nr:hypothetical protein [Shewanella putrefaciens]MCA1898676.1 hypothetical protein [Shewanella putrefaciens]
MSGKSSYQEQAEFFTRFDFFTRKRASPKLLEWVIKYLSKKGIFVSEQTISQVKNTLFIAFHRNNKEKATFDFFYKMEKAWDAHERRQSSNKTMLNVSISKEHKIKFSKMAKDKGGYTKIQMLESLIDDNYKNFIRLKEQELIAKDTEKAKKAEINKNKSYTNQSLSSELSLQENYNNRLKKQMTELKNELQAVKDNSSILFTIIEKAVKKRSKLTADHLMQATRAHTLIDIVQLPLEKPIETTESEENTEQNQTSGPRHRKRARLAKTTST